MSGMKYGEKSFIYNFLKPWLGDGLLVSNGNRKMRSCNKIYVYLSR